MKDMTGAEIKVISVIIRKTLGWHKDKDRLSLGQIQELSGLSKNAVKEGILLLKEKDLIIVNRTGRGKGIKTYFELNVSENDLIEDANGSKNDTLEPPNGSESDPTKDTIKEKKQKKEQYAPSVNMTEAQYVTLIYDYGHGITAEAIEKLSIYKQAKGKKYTSDYHAILNWVIDEVAGKKREEIKALRNAEREKRKGQRKTMRLIDTDKLEQRLTPAETKEFIKGIAGKMPTV